MANSEENHPTSEPLMRPVEELEQRAYPGRGGYEVEDEAGDGTDLTAVPVVPIGTPGVAPLPIAAPIPNPAAPDDDADERRE